MCMHISLRAVRHRTGRDGMFPNMCMGTRDCAGISTSAGLPAWVQTISCSGSCYDIDDRADACRETGDRKQ